jgi:hypothetical protein
MAGKVFRHNRGKEPIFFEVEKDDGELLRFDCRPSIPGGLILAFTDMIGRGDDATVEEKTAAGRSAIQVMKDLLQAAIMPAQRNLFWDMLNGKSTEGMIDAEQMMEIAEHLGEAYAERPTGQPSESGSPTTSNGSPSRDGQPPAVVTYSRSTPADSSTSSNTGEKSVPL